MRSSKPKQTQAKRVLVQPHEQPQPSPPPSTHKQPSTHTKMSTNCTIHSQSGPHPSPDKRPKVRRNGKTVSVQNSGAGCGSGGCPKSVRKGKTLQIRLQAQSDCQPQEPSSHREYWLLDHNFVPLHPALHHKLVHDMLAQTATSSSHFNPTSPQHPTHPLRKRTITPLEMPQLNNKQDKAVSNMHSAKMFASAAVEAATESCDIGLQYSERREWIQEKPPVIQDEKDTIQIEHRIGSSQLVEMKGEKQDANKEAQTSKDKIEDSNCQESLSDLLFKLQFSHLGDDHSFNSLTHNQKEHFSQLLETFIQKLNLRQTPKTHLKPICFDSSPHFPQTNRDSILQDSNSDLRQPPILLPSEKAANLCSLLQYQKLQNCIALRQLKQLSYVQDQTTEADEDSINTSLISVLNFLSHLFCHIQVQYSEEFVYMVRKMYGQSYRQKYKCITRRLPIASNRNFKVVDEAILEDFLNDNDWNCSNINEVVHLRAIFDALNEHLDEYRPFFLGNGEQFPWAFKMFTTMSEYSIDEDSLPIIFRQAKDKIVEWISNLCGIIVDQSPPPSSSPTHQPSSPTHQPSSSTLALKWQQETLQSQHPLKLKRNERENRLIVSWIAEENFEKDGIELYGTQTLHDATELITNHLLEELFKDAPFLLN